MSKVDVVEILKKSDALLEGHFLLSSGKHSNRYVQCAKVLRFPQYAEQVLSTVVEQIKDRYRFSSRTCNGWSYSFL